MKKSIGVIGLFFMLFVLAACTEEDNESAEENEEEVITSVQTEEVEEGNLTRERTFNARMEPSQTTPIMIEQPLEVDTLEVSVGDTVEENDIIAELTLDGNTQSVDAPEAGEIIQIQAEEGENIDPEEPFIMIADTEEWKAAGSASEGMLELLDIDDEVTVEASGEEKTATITNMDRIPDDTGLYPVTATFEAGDASFVSGAVAKIVVDETVESDALIVPTEAVVENEGESFVFVVTDDETVEQREVSVISMQSQQTAIEGDIEAEEEIVITGQSGLEDGDPVEVVKGE
ncbi:efflux RND transporter periplasmic adaptor subunit [Oceanobacillus jeddahense]|uniref:Efflux RND transporter periplasmic adaptor subunit n=1 Tax=Oceanobacillus jeddahense TaxID=1462527 RepID=A0ABY5JQK1_9BACI|nr:efflux RND transporter periplasmic adaptor subunit [Oceanobacillus jeddahense]UUI02583.1 efflux RND transporter periplasmic adaptor subunit [Oceanobacillus jeddahense]